MWSSARWPDAAGAIHTGRNANDRSPTTRAMSAGDAPRGGERVDGMKQLSEAVSFMATEREIKDAGQVCDRLHPVPTRTARDECVRAFAVAVRGLPCCGIASCGVPRPSLAPDVTGMGPMDGATAAAGGRSCCLSSRSNRCDKLLRMITQFLVQLLWLPFLFQNQN